MRKFNINAIKKCLKNNETLDQLQFTISATLILYNKKLEEKLKF
jgi:hypothetical protein